MDGNKRNSPPFSGVADSLKEYVNLKADEYKLRGVEGLSTLFNLIFFMLVATIVAGVALQMFGLAAGYAIGEMLGSASLGFAIMGVLYAAAVAVLYLLRRRLFINRLVRMFVRADRPSITNIGELRAARRDLEQMAGLKEDELRQEVKVVKEALDPVRFFNRVVSQICSLEYLLRCFAKGYDLVKDWLNKNYNRNN